MSSKLNFAISAVVALCFCFIGGTTPTLADIINVPGDQPTIQAGIDAAVNGDEVVVADGVYTGDGNRDIDFDGKLITVRSENGPDNCIIDCQGTEADRRSDPSSSDLRNLHALRRRKRTRCVRARTVR